MSRSQLSFVGLFVIGGVLMFAVGVFMIGDRRALFAERFELSADFGNVTGFQIGTRVRVAGFDAGEILRIAIPGSPTDRFLVSMRIREEVRLLVRTDSVVAVLTDGLLGNVFLQIREGTEAASVVESGDRIRGIDAIELADLIEEGRDTFRTLSTEFLGLRQDFGRTINSLDDTVQSTTLLLNDVGNDVRSMTTVSTLFVDEVRGIAAETRGIIGDVRAGQGTIGRLLTDDALFNQAATAAEDMAGTVRALRETAEQTRQAVADFRSPGGDGEQILRDTREMLATARNAASDLAENTEALKRHFLFRGFFNDRGFFNLDAMTLAEYRQLSQDDRYTPLRIWLDAGMLFSADADGEEHLTDAGRQRLDSAMAELLRYPRDSPLVVEGYSVAERREVQYVTSSRRADAAREYLISTFGRIATLTGTMPVGDGAVGSPRADGRWDGIALTMFVRPEALAENVAAAAQP